VLGSVIEPSEGTLATLYSIGIGGSMKMDTEADTLIRASVK
jgi:hypothetical protein